MPTIKVAACALMNLPVAKAVVPHAEAVAAVPEVAATEEDTKAAPEVLVVEAIKEKAAVVVATKAVPVAAQDIAAAAVIKAVMSVEASKRRKVSTSLSRSSRKRSGRRGRSVGFRVPITCYRVLPY